MRKANLPVDGLDEALSRLDEVKPQTNRVGGGRVEEEDGSGGIGQPQTADIIWTIPAK